MPAVLASEPKAVATLGSGSGVVEATERLYRSLFTAAVGYAVVTWTWGIVLAPFNGYKDDRLTSALLCAAAAAAAGLAFWRRDQLFYALRNRPAWLVAMAFGSVAVLWADGGWHSTAYLATYSPIMMAAVAASLRWTVVVGVVMAIGYASGVLVHGYTPERLIELKDLELSIANMVGYLLAAFFFSLPTRWLGSYVARINQVIAARPRGTELSRQRTRTLSVREVEVTQLVAEGMTNDAIAARLVLSPRTVQSHVAHALEKTGASSRTELAMISVREGLVPLVRPEVPTAEC